VNNLIVVHSQSASSTEIEQAIHEALERRAQLEADRIQVRFDEGTVTLTGHVGTWKEKHAIIEAVNHAPGVQTIKDHLQVAAYI
jgi:osmotically-inducible protein OsmY